MIHLPIALIFALITVILSFTTIARVYFKHYTGLAKYIFHLTGSLLCATLIFFVGAWAYVSFYLRWVFLLLYVAAVVISFIRLVRKEHSQRSIGRWYYVAYRLIFTLLIGALVYLYFSARYYSGDSVSLKFPFRRGSYYVMQGGANRLSNPAHRNYSQPKYGFAMDISKLYPSGNRARGIMPSNVEDYAIYGDTVICPCSGRVIKVVDTVHTNKPGHFNVNNVHGNHIIIQARGYRVFLAHFIKGKVFVKEGDKVDEGTALGLSGNSGFSQEPHLHVNVLRNYDTVPYNENRKIENRGTRTSDLIYDDFRYSGTSYPFNFDGKFYIINDIIRR